MLKLNVTQLLRLLAVFYTLSLFYLHAEIIRAYTRKNYATVDIPSYQETSQRTMQKMTGVPSE